MKFIISATALVAVVAATPLKRQASALEATITQAGNSAVNVALKNLGNADLNLLVGGSILDDAPVDKVYVTSANATAPFIGITKRMLLSGLEQDAFLTIAAGETIEKEIQVAQLYDLSTSGLYEVIAAGTIPYAESGSTEITGVQSYESNTVSLDIDGEAASAISSLHDIGRTIIQSDCSGTRLSAVTAGLRACASQASAAASQAASGSATRFQTFFRTTATATRNTVAARLRAVASDCSSSSSGVSRTYCNDPYGYCTSGVLAYAVPSANNINYCPSFYSLPAVTRSCYAQDQAGTVLHEETHVPAVYSPGTNDYAYGFSASTRLSAAQAVGNADTYTLFANAVSLGC